MAASSSSDVRWKYDVFINFRGEDTHTGFISHLYRALLQKPINTFVDAEELRKGDRLCELLTGIQESRLSLVVFSQNYALSTCCLKELVEILECSYTKNQIVVPIFYQVDPATVRKLKGTFAKAFVQHDHDSNLYSKSKMVDVESWRSALTTATNISGLGDPRNYKNEAELIEKIVEDVYTKLMQFSSTSSKYDVFINFREEDIDNDFINDLYGALLQKQINTFIDAEKLIREDDRLPELLTAIRESSLSLVVFSRNYALSTCCLKELMEILECRDTKNQIVVPIFYQVDQANVREVKGTFAKAFSQHKHDSNSKMLEVGSWRSALTTATNFSGWDPRNYKDDAELIEEIVEDVFTKLMQFSSTLSKYL